MNVFVLSTGRCGSTTFIKACKQITNYSCAHESRIALLGQERLNYPENHIEADNRLSWLLGRLDEKYGDSAFYVHLKRDKTETARSFTKRYDNGMIKAYRGSGILMGLAENSDPMSVALDYCDTVNTNIDLFLKDKTHKLTMNLETITGDFQEFWKLIHAEGNLDAALAKFNIKFNSTSQVQQRNKKRLASRITRKAKRVVVGFPTFVKDV